MRSQVLSSSVGSQLVKGLKRPSIGGREAKLTHCCLSPKWLHCNLGLAEEKIMGRAGLV